MYRFQREVGIENCGYCVGVLCVVYMSVWCVCEWYVWYVLCVCVVLVCSCGYCVGVLCVVYMSVWCVCVCGGGGCVWGGLGCGMCLCAVHMCMLSVCVCV
jgi:hypothetical protein